jgi:hypothetical protein
MGAALRSHARASGTAMPPMSTRGPPTSPGRGQNTSTSSAGGSKPGRDVGTTRAWPTCTGTGTTPWAGTPTTSSSSAPTRRSPRSRSAPPETSGSGGPQTARRGRSHSGTATCSSCPTRAKPTTSTRSHAGHGPKVRGSISPSAGSASRRQPRPEWLLPALVVAGVDAVARHLPVTERPVEVLALIHRQQINTLRA